MNKMGKNIELAVMAALLAASGMLEDMKGRSIAHRNNYNPAFDSRNIRKISNLKYCRIPKSRFYQRKTF